MRSSPAICVLTVFAIASGLWVARRPADLARADVELWVFADSHWRSYHRPGPDGRSPLQRFTGSTGKSVRARLVQFRAVNLRLAALKLANRPVREWPDAVELELGSVARFIRGPIASSMLMPLDDALDASDLRVRLPAARLASWSQGGQVVGIPHDVHPVALAYRDDLFRAAGIDLSTRTTWPAFAEALLAYQKHWTTHGHLNRRGIEWPDAAGGPLITLLTQRGLSPQHLLDPRVAETIEFYARHAAGAERIGGSVSAGDAVFSRDFATGDIGVLWMPDWRVELLKRLAPELAGNVKLMPLPAWPGETCRTSTQGGTMIGIPRLAPDPDAAFALIAALYFDRDVARQSMRDTFILPPLRDVWADPINDEADAYFGGQRARALFVELAGELPPRDISAAALAGEGAATIVMTRAVALFRNDAGASARPVEGWLVEADADIARRIARAEAVR